MPTIERDVLERLESLGLRWYVTGSWSLGVYAEPRMTRDIDIVIDAPPATYDALIRPAFESDFLVNELIEVGGRAIGGLIHKRQIVRVDLILGRTDGWARSAMDRRRQVHHPTLGAIWNSTPEDLIIAKLEWSDGASELQMRDVRSLVRLVSDLDWPYLERYAAALGIGDRVEAVRGD
ncbi:MAG: hypothetical protein H0T59_11205 [Chloroflexi bacterium]|nr:hypothetical protein [Chloroflexota bacterium]